MASETEYLVPSEGTREYIDLVFGNEFNVPPIPPNFLIAVISMIIRNPESGEVKDIIQSDPLLNRVIFDRDNYDKKLIIALVKIVQQAYGTDFPGFGPFSKGVSYTRDEYTELLFKSLSLIWNYSPVISGDDTLNIINNFDK